MPVCLYSGVPFNLNQKLKNLREKPLIYRNFDKIQSELLADRARTVSTKFGLPGQLFVFSTFKNVDTQMLGRISRWTA